MKNKKLSVETWLGEKKNVYVGNWVRIKWFDRWFKVLEVNRNAQTLKLEGYEGYPELPKGFIRGLYILEVSNSNVKPKEYTRNRFHNEYPNC